MAVELDNDYKPTEDEPFMNERQREYFKRKLLAWKDEILQESRETLLVLQNDNENHPDFADRASSETDRSIELRSRDRQRKLISKIDAALARIDEGVYGYCEETPRCAPNRYSVDRGAGAARAAREGLSRRLSCGTPPGRGFPRAGKPGGRPPRSASARRFVFQRQARSAHPVSSSGDADMRLSSRNRFVRGLPAGARRERPGGRGGIGRRASLRC
jgi:DnaK suppressor protein